MRVVDQATGADLDPTGELLAAAAAGPRGESLYGVESGTGGGQRFSGGVATPRRAPKRKTILSPGHESTRHAHRR